MDMGVGAKSVWTKIFVQTEPNLRIPPEEKFGKIKKYQFILYA